MSAQVLVICGPTASGKTRLAVELAQRTGGEVVSADSMQVYRRMDVGTAKPTAQEMGGVPHHMLDVAEPWEDFSVARYTDMAKCCVDDILSRGRLPIITGGTGLYIDALLAGTSFAPFHGGWREKLQARAAAEGVAPLHEELRRVDPERAQRLHPSDEKRILRALEVYLETGETITEHDRRTQSQPPRYTAGRIVLNYAERADLWARIDTRVDEMVENGLEAEVRALVAEGVPRRCTAMQAIGYKELLSALEEGRSLEGAAEEIKLRSRQYAKRQLTWFRRYEGALQIQWNKMPNFSCATQNSTAYLEEIGLL